MHDSEAVFFVNDDETEILEFHVLLQQAVCADNDIHVPFSRVLQHLSDFFRSQKAAHHLDAHRMIAEAMAKSL